MTLHHARAGSPGTPRTTSTRKQKLRRRPRDAALLLPEPRLPRVQRRVDAGLDHARQGRTSTSRSTSPRDRTTRSRDVQLAGELLVPEAELRRLIRVKPGDMFSRARLQPIDEGDQRPPRQRRLRVRQRERGARARPREATRRRSRSSSIRAGACTCAGSTSAATPKTRDEVIRRELRQLEGAWYDGPRIERSKVRIHRLGYFSRTSTSRRRRCRARTDQVDVKVTVTEKIDRQPARRRRLLDAGRRRVQRLGLAAEHLRLRQRAGAQRQHEQDQPHVSRSPTPSRTGRSTASRAPSTSTSAKIDPTGARDRAVLVGHARRRRSASACRSPRSTRSTSASASSAPSSTLFDGQPAGLPRLRPGLRRRRPTASSAPAAGRATPATTSSIRRAAGCRARWSRSACRRATSRTTSPSTSTSGSARSTATSC